jgi:hypothetical protein
MSLCPASPLIAYMFRRRSTSISLVVFLRGTLLFHGLSYVGPLYFRLRARRKRAALADAVEDEAQDDGSVLLVRVLLVLFMLWALRSERALDMLPT